MAVEALEGRRLFSTVVVYDDFDPEAGAGVGATWSSGAPTGFGGMNNTHFSYSSESFTVHLSALPEHTMMAVSFYWEVYDDATLTVSAGDTTQWATNEASGGFSHSDNYWRWFAHSESSIDITFAAGSTPNGMYLGEVYVQAYQPTVSLAGSGTVVEDGTGGATFTVNRDLPTGWNATLGDAAVPATTVTLQDTGGGTATSGVDYEPLPTSLTIPTSATGSTPYSVVPIDDPDAEDIETIFASVGQPANGAIYVLAAPPATAPATNPTTQKVDVGDDVAVKEIKVVLDANFAQENKISGYKFRAKIEIYGENVHLMQFQQKINSSTSVTKEDGNAATAQDLPGLDSVMSNSNGWAIDPNLQGAQLEWANLQAQPNTKNGYGFVEDTHTFNLGTIQVPYGNQQAETTFLIHATRYMQDKIRDGRVGKQDNILATLDWGFKWSNWNTIWQAGDPIAPPAGVVKIACDKKDTGKGYFYDVQTILGLTF